MTPLYLNPPCSSPDPFPNLNKDHDDHDQEQQQQQQQHLFMISSPLHDHHQPSNSSTTSPANSLSCPFSSTSTTNQIHDFQRETHLLIRDHPQHHEQIKANKSISQGGASSYQYSSFSPLVDETNNIGYHKLSVSKQDPELHVESIDNNGSAKWMSSKVRLMHEMMNSNSTVIDDDDDDHDDVDDDDYKPATKITIRPQDHHHHHHNKIPKNTTTTNNSTTIRVCSDCNTTTTPLWRSGPQGPKSLCNACGIRQRKARRDMAEAANGTGEASTIMKTNNNYKVVNNKEKKSRTGLDDVAAAIKKQCKPSTFDHTAAGNSSQKKLCFKNFAVSLTNNNSTFQRVFPRDEEEAAILLMELSCGLVHS